MRVFAWFWRGKNVAAAPATTLNAVDMRGAFVDMLLFFSCCFTGGALTSNVVYIRLVEMLRTGVRSKRNP